VHINKIAFNHLIDNFNETVEEEEVEEEEEFEEESVFAGGSLSFSSSEIFCWNILLRKYQNYSIK